MNSHQHWRIFCPPWFWDTPQWQSPNPKKRRISGKWYPGLGKVSSFKKFYLIRQLSKKPGRAVWRKVTLRPPGLLWMPPSPAVVTIKRPAIQPSPSLSTHFSINMKMAKESQTQIYFINLHQVFNGKTPLRSSFKWFALLAKSWNLVSSEAYRDLRIWKLASMKWIVSNKRLVLKGAKWTTRI